jgi:hypothetical protein
LGALRATFAHGVMDTTRIVQVLQQRWAAAAVVLDLLYPHG